METRAKQQDLSLILDDGPFTPTTLIESTRPDEFLHAAQVDFKSEQEIIYTSVFIYEDNTPYLYLFPQIDLDPVDFANTQGLVLRLIGETNSKPMDSRRNAFSRNCDQIPFLLGDNISYSRVVLLKRNFTQRSIGYFAQDCAQISTDVIIQKLVYQNLPEEYYKDIIPLEPEEIDHSRLLNSSSREYLLFVRDLSSLIIPGA